MHDEGAHQDRKRNINISLDVVGVMCGSRAAISASSGHSSKVPLSCNRSTNSAIAGIGRSLTNIRKRPAKGALGSAAMLSSRDSQNSRM